MRTNVVLYMQPLTKKKWLQQLEYFLRRYQSLKSKINVKGVMGTQNSTAGIFVTNFQVKRICLFSICLQMTYEREKKIPTWVNQKKVPFLHPPSRHFHQLNKVFFLRKTQSRSKFAHFDWEFLRNSLTRIQKVVPLCTGDNH